MVPLGLPQHSSAGVLQQGHGSRVCPRRTRCLLSMGLLRLGFVASSPSRLTTAIRLMPITDGAALWLAAPAYHSGGSYSLAQPSQSGNAFGSLRCSASSGVQRCQRALGNDRFWGGRTTTTCRGCMSGHRQQEPVWTSVRGAGVRAGSSQRQHVVHLRHTAGCGGHDLVRARGDAPGEDPPNIGVPPTARCCGAAVEGTLARGERILAYTGHKLTGDGKRDPQVLTMGIIARPLEARS